MSLFEFARDGKFDEIKTLFKTNNLTKKDILKERLCDSVYLTPLHVACENGHLEIVRFFIEKGKLSRDEIMKNYGSCENLLYQPDIRDRALIIASENGHIEIVKLLIEKCNLRKKDIVPKNNGGIGIPSLCRASCYGHLEIVKLFIKDFDL